MIHSINSIQPQGRGHLVRHPQELFKNAPFGKERSLTYAVGAGAEAAAAGSAVAVAVGSDDASLA